MHLVLVLLKQKKVLWGKKIHLLNTNLISAFFLLSPNFTSGPIEEMASLGYCKTLDGGTPKRHGHLQKLQFSQLKSRPRDFQPSSPHPIVAISTQANHTPRELRVLLFIPHLSEQLLLVESNISVMHRKAYIFISYVL